MTLLSFIAPQTGLSWGAAQLADLAETIERLTLILDSVGEAMAVGGIDEDRDNEVGPWLRKTLRHIKPTRTPSRRHASRSTIRPKPQDNPLFPSGSKQKSISGRPPTPTCSTSASPFGDRRYVG